MTEDIMTFLECNDPNKYRKKIKGFHMAFNIRDKAQRIPEEERSKYKIKNVHSDDEPKKHVEELKSKKVLQRVV
jgi:hypothetical protein